MAKKRKARKTNEYRTLREVWWQEEIIRTERGTEVQIIRELTTGEGYLAS